MHPTPSTDYHEANTASAILKKIGSGSADADFARAMRALLDRVVLTGKKGKLICTVEVEQSEVVGSLIVRADLVAKLPKLPPPASQMHMTSDGQLLTQMEFLMEGGRDESQRPAPIAAPAAVPAPAPSASGRLPALGPVAAPPAPAPLAAFNPSTPAGGDAARKA